MPEVNLKDYFNRLSNLIGESAADEVIHHCRHILQYYPKNVDVYRFLGRALVLIGRWDEAQAALRRVLSVIPDDFVANVALGEVFEATNRCDEAIWHLERALDIRPNDKTIIDVLRVLYHRCRQTDQQKIQMTASSVARQHLRSGSPEYAVETLRSALKQAPDRVDLKLLLAQTLSQTGQVEEAAENALDVLNLLPDCLVANRILAELWLSYDRPSDAQQYVNRVESVDPYLAVELVQGVPPEDDAFRVEELDYRRSAQTEVVSSRPDWLKDLVVNPTVDTPEEPAASTEADEWANWSSGMLSTSATSAAPDSQDEQDDLNWLSDFPVRQDDVFNTSAPGMSTGDLEKLFGSDAENTLPSNMSGAQQKPSDEDDPFAWAQTAGVQLVDEPEDEEPAFDDFFDEADAPLPDQNINPLAWMQPFGSEMMVDESTLPSPPREDWYSAQNDELGVDGSLYESAQTNSEAGDADSTVEELDWLRSAAPLDEMFDSDDQASEENPFESTGRGGAMAESQPDIASTGSESESDDDLFALFDEKPEVQDADIDAVPGPRRGLTAILSEANLDWMQKTEDASNAVVSEDDMDEWLMQFGPPSSAKVVETENPDWLASLTEPDELIDAETGDVSATFTEVQEEPMLMSESERPEDKEQPEGSDMPNWLSDFKPDDEEETVETTPGASLGEDDEFSWSSLSTFEEAEPTGTAEDDDLEEGVPDWLREAAPEMSVGVDAEAPGDEDSADAFNWLTDDALANAEAEAAAGSPSMVGDELEPGDDWLSEFAPEGEIDAAAIPGMEIKESPASIGDQPLQTDDLEWLNDLGGGAASEAGESGALEAEIADSAIDEIGAVPDWLAAIEIQPETESEETLASAVASEQPALDEETFDWLSSMPEAELPGAALDLGAIPAMGETIGTSGEDIPDWLVGLDDDSEIEQPLETEMESPAASSEMFGWEGEATDAPDAVGAFAADTGDEDANDAAWSMPVREYENAEDTLLLRPDEMDMTSIESDADKVTAEEPEYDESFFEGVSEAEPFAAAAGEEMPAAELMGQMDQEEQPPETSGEEVPEPVGGNEMSVAEPIGQMDQEEQTPEAVGEETPEPTVGEEEPVAELMSQMDQEEAFEAADEEMPQPEMATEEESASEVSGEEAIPEEIVAEEMPSEEALSEQEVAEEPLSEEATDVFMESEPEHFDEEVHPTPAENAPDWLNAMVPGLDVDYEAQENILPDEEFEEEEPLPIHAENDAALGEFGWLVRIVDDEVEADTAARPAVAVPKFVFSHPPAWMRQSSAPDDDLPDWPVDDDAGDVPEWLR